MEKTLYRIEEVAKQTGLTKRTLRYYEDLELLQPIRTDSGYRLYSEADIEKIRRIMEIKEVLGFCLNEIKDILELERNLKRIFSGAAQDPAVINQSLEMMQAQMKLVEEKEQRLARVKTKYQETYRQLKKLGHDLNERNVSQHEKN